MVSFFHGQLKYAHRDEFSFERLLYIGNKEKVGVYRGGFVDDDGDRILRKTLKDKVGIDEDEIFDGRNECDG